MTKVDGITRVLAIYAAIVATASVAWNVFVYRQTHRTKVVVEPEVGVTKIFDGGPQPALRLVLRNVSARSVTIERVYIDRGIADPMRKEIHPSPGWQQTPLTVPQRSEEELFYPMGPDTVTSDGASLRALLIAGNCRFVAQLDNGMAFCSKPRKLVLGQERLE